MPSKKHKKSVNIPVKVIVTENYEKEPYIKDMPIKADIQDELEDINESISEKEINQSDVGFIKEKKEVKYTDLDVSQCIEDVVYKEVDFPESGFVAVEKTKDKIEKNKNKSKSGMFGIFKNSKHGKMPVEKKVGVLWFAVVSLSVILFAGWIISLKYSNFFQLNMMNSANEFEDFGQSMEESFEGFSTFMEMNMEELNLEHESILEEILTEEEKKELFEGDLESLGDAFEIPKEDK